MLHPLIIAIFTVNTSLTVIYWAWVLSDAYYKMLSEPEDNPRKPSAYMTHGILELLPFTSQRKQPRGGCSSLDYEELGWATNPAKKQPQSFSALLEQTIL
ncbi:hypothetical protein FQN60_002457 [Etheostoma spectabile]|uniref:Uncharacterized protein n=1 Tax=Etheostoma spectabile TaxID=54343 RepID=A0A5J5CAQ9_9PERO|nr:hypothetical protein FQN60_002457 [Etheostoma spectabile]